VWCGIAVREPHPICESHELGHGVRVKQDGTDWNTM
jgi:hypothetical protein